MKTTKSIRSEDIMRKWYLVDAADKVLGRLATAVALRLRGKHKAEYTPNQDLGDHVVVINAAKIRVTGNKKTDKIYYRHTGYPGGIKSINFEELLQSKPEFVIEHAVKGMLPKGPLGRKMFGKLKVYAGSEHPHAAQQPEILETEVD
jgi:large subunit ribosomal protein L13